MTVFPQKQNQSRKPDFQLWQRCHLSVMKPETQSDAELVFNKAVVEKPYRRWRLK